MNLCDTMVCFYRGSQYVELMNINQIAAVTLVNGQLGVSHGPVRYVFFMKNLTNKYYLDSAFGIPSLRQVAPSFGERRTIGAPVRPTPCMATSDLR